MCMLIIIIKIISGCIIIYLLIFIQHKSNTLLSFIPNYNTQYSNNNIQNDNYSLKNEIEKLKQDIIRLNNENSLLKDENQRLKNENQYLKNDLNIKSKDLKKNLLKIDELNIALTNKNDEINNLNNEIKNIKLNDNQKNEFIRKDEMLTIQFKSIDQKVDTVFTCKKTDVFVRIEEMLYNEYPEFKDLNTYFTVNGQVVRRFRNMQENKIRNKDKILLNIYE